LVLIGAVAAMLAINRLMRRHDRLRREASAIVASIGDAVLVTDSDWNVLWVNPALEKLVGWPSSEIRGRPAAQTFRLFDERGDRADFRDSGQLSVEDKEGNRVPIQITTAPLLDESGGMLGHVVVTRDVSREREIDSLKSNLVSTVSHELRTPLTMIKGFSELLLTKDLSKERFEKALVEINNSADRLSRLIDDLLSVSRIESGRLGLDLQDVEIRDVIEALISSFSDRENRRFFADADDLTVRGDEDKVVQILTNLLSNAVKYSHDGSAIRITAHRSEGSAEIAVTDEGIGLTDSDTQMVFEKFGRVERPEVQQAGGTGLGLYITKSLVEAHGGQIWVEPGPGNAGSRFAFTLPLSEKEAMVK
jgi:PAS domain S-box-containing protein